MSYSRYPLCIAVLAILLARGNGGRTVIIPKTSSVIEHSPLRLDCFYEDYSALPNTTKCRWSKVDNGTTRGIAFFYENCLFKNYFENIFDFECTNKTANSLIINSTGRNLHETVFICKYIVNDTTEYSNTATIRVSVPVSSVNLTQPETDYVNTTENKKVTFTCNASAAHPKPNITWHSDSHTPSDYRDDVEITKNITVLFDYDGYLYTVISNMTFYPAKYDNGSRIYCNASNIERKSISSTRKTLLYVLYPPSTPAFFTRSNVSLQNVAVIINNSFTIVCKSSGNPFPSYVWTTSQNKEVSGEDLNIENIKTTDDGMYSCMAYNTLDDNTYHKTSASIEVTVLYPPDSPKLYYIRSGITQEIFNSTINVVKEDNFSVLCNSTGKPHPVSGWNGAESSDTLSINSIDADLNYTCTSSNVMTETEGRTKSVFESRMLKMHVLYPPVTPVIKVFLSEDYVEAQDLVNVVENTNISLKCSAESKPPSNISWSRPVNDIKQNSSKQLFVHRILRSQSGTYTCHAANEMVRSFWNVGIGKNNRSTYIGVLYPPDTPSFFYIKHENKHKIDTLPLKVVEGDNVSVLCNATGNPTPTSVWVDSVADTDILSLVFVELNHQTNFTCKSFNMMNDSFVRSLNGTSSKNFSIFVLHPPRTPVILIELWDSTMEGLNYTGILEGSEFRLHCNAVSSPPSSYKWTGPVSSNHHSAELPVSNIQRNQSGPYICYAQNKMERSYGNNETGRNNQSIYFNILYKAAIKYFGAADFENNKNIMTVNQGEAKLIMCKVESNPFSNSTIFFEGRLVNETIRSDAVTYNVIDSNCSDAGRYICKGKNEYNYEADASKELFLYVKCLPQPSVSQPPEKNVSAALSDSALFRFHAAPYYDPGITEFRWFKQEDDRRILLQNVTKTYISSSDIHSVLRIIDVSLADYGVYILEYNNSVGMNDFTFYLQQRDATVSEEIQHGNDKNYLPIVIGVIIAVLVIVGITVGMVIYIRRYKQKTDSNSSDRSYDNICGMNTKSGENNIKREPVYEGLKPIDERGYVEMKEQTYDILKLKDSAETKDPVYTNLKL